jgi:hypothetical protein
MADKEVLFYMKADITFYSTDIESALKKVAEHLTRVADDPNCDKSLLASGWIEIEKVKNENHS